MTPATYGKIIYILSWSDEQQIYSSTPLFLVIVTVGSYSVLSAPLAQNLK